MVHITPVSRLTRNVNVLSPVCEGKEGLNVILTLLFLDVATRVSECQRPNRHKRCLEKILNHPFVIDWKCEEIIQWIQQYVFAPNCSILEGEKRKAQLKWRWLSLFWKLGVCFCLVWDIKDEELCLSPLSCSHGGCCCCCCCLKCILKTCPCSEVWEWRLVLMVSRLK